MKKSLVGLILTGMLIATPANASTTGFGSISMVYASQNGAIIFTLNGTSRTTPPACQNSSVPDRWAIDASTVAGQAQVAVLLNAQASGKKIWINGAETCSIWPDTETVFIFQVED